MKTKEGKLKDWTQKMKKWTHKINEWTMKYYVLSKKDIAYGILLQSTTIMEEPISDPWAR